MSTIPFSTETILEASAHSEQCDCDPCRFIVAVRLCLENGLREQVEKEIAESLEEAYQDGRRLAFHEILALGKPADLTLTLEELTEKLALTTERK